MAHASAWGKSFGKAWGGAFGRLLTPTPPSGSSSYRHSLYAELPIGDGWDEEEHEVLAIISAFLRIKPWV